MNKQAVIDSNHRNSPIVKLSREFFWIILGKSVAVIGSIVGVRLLTEVLNPTAYGELALGMTAAMLTQQLVLGPIAGASLRFFAPAQEANELGSYLQGLRILLKKATVVILVVSTMFASVLWFKGYINYLGLVCAALVYSLISGYNSTLDGMQNAARQRPVVAWHQGAGQWLRFLLAVALIQVLGELSSVAMIGYAVASFIVFISQLLFYKRKILSLNLSTQIKHQYSIDKWYRQMFTYAWPFATWGIFTWAHLASDRWALQIVGDISSVGLYAVLYQLGYSPIMLLSSLMVQLIAPILFSQAGDASDVSRMKRTRYLNNLMVLLTICLTGLLTVFALVFHGKVFSLLVAPDYRTVSYLLPLMVLAGGMFASGQVASIYLLSNIDTQKLILPKIGSASIGVLLNLIGAYLLGIRQEEINNLPKIKLNKRD